MSPHLSSNVSSSATPIRHCVCCGSADLAFTSVLWEGLIQEWELNETEADYIDRQQGLHCQTCCTNLRSMALAQALMVSQGFRGHFAEFVRQPSAQSLRCLELNPAGSLTQFLTQLPRHTLKSYPEVDMMALDWADASFDIVCHSDTLEHIAAPVKALAECYRVLKPGGILAFTVPIVVDRLTRSRQGLLPSYHGDPTAAQSDFLVYTEYGSDVWQQVLQAGFPECRLISLEYPAALALVAVK